MYVFLCSKRYFRLHFQVSLVYLYSECTLLINFRLECITQLMENKTKQESTFKIDSAELMFRSESVKHLKIFIFSPHDAKIVVISFHFKYNTNDSQAKLLIPPNRNKFQSKMDNGRPDTV